MYKGVSARTTERRSTFFESGASFFLVRYMVELIRNDTLPAARRLSYVRYMKSMAVTLHKATADTSLFPGDWTRAANPGGRSISDAS